MILGPVLVGLYWLRRRPASKFGPLLLFAGLVGGIPYILQSLSGPVPFAAGVFWEGVIYAATLALILGFPSGRFGRPERVLLAVGAVGVMGAYLGLVLFGPQISGQSAISVCAPACPANGLMIASEPDVRRRGGADRQDRGDPRGARDDRADRAAAGQRHAAAPARAGDRRARRARLPRLAGRVPDGEPVRAAGGRLLPRRPVDDRRDAIGGLVRVPVRADRGRAVRRPGAAPGGGRIAEAARAGRARGDAQRAPRRPAAPARLPRRGQPSPNREAGASSPRSSATGGRPRRSSTTPSSPTSPSCCRPPARSRCSRKRTPSSKRAGGTR